jgi:hypothetical protein
MRAALAASGTSDQRNAAVQLAHAGPFSWRSGHRPSNSHLATPQDYPFAMTGSNK